jgi:hypothetical protein
LKEFELCRSAGEAIHGFACGLRVRLSENQTPSPVAAFGFLGLVNLACFVGEVLFSALAAGESAAVEFICLKRSGLYKR